MNHFRTIFIYMLVSLALLVSNTTLNAQSSKVKNIGMFNKADAVQMDFSSATITTTDKGVNLAYKLPNGVNQSSFAGTLTGQFDGNPAKFYCIDIYTHLQWNVPYKSAGNTSEEITYILNNYYPFNSYPYSGAMGEEKREAAAVQMAVWHFSDGVDPNTMTNESSVKTRALEIIADADANAGNYVAPETIVITPGTQSLTVGSTAQYEVGIYDINGSPLSGIHVSLEATNGTLSSTDVVTGANGKASFSVTMNMEGTTVITASADVQIPHGTKFVKESSPDESQKLVLATPVSATASAEAAGEWYTPNLDCDLNGYTTYTQGGWGSPSNSEPGQIRDTYFDQVFPNGLTVGGNNSIKLTSAEAVKDFLPQGGTADALTQDYTNPDKKISVLAGQVVAMSLGVYYSEAGVLGTNPNPIGNLLIVGGPFDGMTVYTFLDLANTALGGGSTQGFTLSQINDAATAFNENFNNGTVDKGFLICDNPQICTDNKIGSLVWRDRNVNGIQDANEEGIADVVVELVNANGLVTLTTSTDANGNYLFDGVVNGNYTVRIADVNFALNGTLYSSDQTKWYLTFKDAGSNDEKDSDGDENYTASASVDCGNDLAVDFGFFKSCVTIEKTGPASVVAGSTIEYTFTITNCGDLTLKGGVDVYDAMLNPSGDHKINHKTPVNPGDVWTFKKTYQTSTNDCGDFINTAKAVGHPVMPDNSYKPNVEQTSSWTTNVDCTAPAKLGDKVWLDVNKNGIQDNGEAGVENVVVKLYDCSNNFIAQTETNSSGNYYFENLVPGSYTVKFVLPSGYEFTLQNQGTDAAKNSDANPADGKTTCITLAPGQTDLTWDAGLYIPEPEKASIGDKVWYDTNKNGIQDNGENGIEGVTVKLFDCDNHFITQMQTDANGLYAFTELNPGDYKVQFILPAEHIFSPKDEGTDNLKDSDADQSSGKTECTTLEPGENDLSWDAGMYIPSSSLGDKVWLDTNRNGIQDSGENGIQNVTVKLYDCSDEFIAETITDEFGKYLFDGLTAGDYYVVFELPQSYSFSPKNEGSNSELDSDADQTTGKTVCTTLAVDQNDLSWDAGMYVGYASIGDKVWEDTNNNGLQDNGENGFAEITVKLFTCSGDLVDTKVTDSNGNYLFENLLPGSYKLEFEAPNGYSFTGKNAGNDSSIDSDADGFGTTDCTDLVVDENDMTWDAGLVKDIYSADISISKTASNMNPADGDQVIYTLTVTNHGPNNASDIIVTDMLADGLDYISSNPTGVYDANTGIWSVGNLNNGASTSLDIIVKVNAGECNESSFDLGPATGYNLFVWRDFTAPSSDVEGKVAVGRDMNVSNYSVADKLGNAYAGKDVLVVGRDLYFTSGRVYFGNAVYGRASNLPLENVSIDGELRKDTLIDFDAAKTYLKSLSGTLASYTPNGTTTYQWGGVMLEGNDPFLNVFKVDGAELTNSTYMTIDVPNGSVVLVNIKGNDIVWSGGLDVTGTDKTNILFNVYQATNLTITGIEVTGAVLAPKADVDFSNGLLSGQLIAKSMTGNGQLNNHMFGGNIPCPTEITNVADVIDFTPMDPNSDNNSSSVTINVDVQLDPSGDPEDTNDDWVSLGGFGINEIVQCMATDNNGVMFAGTMGGKIYKSSNDGQEWTVINSNMHVGYIWSLAIDNSNGTIWAGTEQGLYNSNDNGASWKLYGLAGQDVHAVVVESADHVFAGAWGFGVYELTQAGGEFAAINDGLTNLIVNALAVNSDGDLFAAIFGSGVYKLAAASGTWENMNAPTILPWTFGITSNGDLYVGGYGDGVFATFDAGVNWYDLSGDLPGQFIYSIVVDNSDNVYLNTWNGGIYSLAGAGSNRVVKGGNDNSVQSVIWQPVGMGGFGVSSLIVNQANSTLYAGTSTGTIYKKVSSVTSVNDEAVPTKFELSQNYPNPFNPSTTIKYSITKAGFFELKVYNILGEQVNTLVAKELQPGNYEVNFNASNLASGIYIYQLIGDNVKFTKKMMLMK